jgi:hypothetical protein
LRKLVLAALTVGACVPDVPQSAGPPPSIVVEFDPGALPPVAPVPNDLAPRDPASGKLKIPPSPTDTLAQTEFNADYLGSLTAFPFESTAQAPVSGPLDPSSVDNDSVVVIDLSQLKSAAAAMQSPTSAIIGDLLPTFDGAASAIVVNPPAAGFTRAHQYAVVFVTPSAAHPAGLRGAFGEPVIGSPAWALVTSPSPLVNCPNGDLTSSQCAVAVDVIPSAFTDPAQRLADQTAKALQLEQLRRQLQPLLVAAEGLLGLPDASSIPMAWTFTIVDSGEMTFDPAHGIVPFPNDLLRPNGRVTLPSPITGQPLSVSDCVSATDPSTALYCGLNTLDGFSTIAPPISENGLEAGAVEQANLSAATLTATSVGLFPLKSSAPVQTMPLYTPCLNCLSSRTAGGAPQLIPQQLQWQLVAPLDETTTYAAYVTTDLTDDEGKSVAATPTFALLRLTNPLVMGGKSQVGALTDLQAAALEPSRLALKPVLDALEANGVARTTVALAWAFTTQSESVDLDGLYAYVGTQSFEPALSPGFIVFADATPTYTAVAGTSVPIQHIDKFYIGVYQTPFALTGPGGTLDVVHPVAEPVTFALAVPAPSAMPAKGYPVTVFGHAITRDHNDFLAIADALAAQGQAILATDAPFHGERSSCTGAGAYLTAAYAAAHPTAPLVQTDDDACADPVAMKCNEDALVGRCVARDDSNRMACPMLPQLGDPTGTLGCAAEKMGACLGDGKCEGGDFARDSTGRPLVSGWNMFSVTNFFETRDNLRQQVIDLAQLVQALRSSTPTSLANRIASAGGAGAATLDLTQINYVGQSLGGILGTLFNAVSPDTTRVALNVAGGDLPTLFLDAPLFAAQRTLLLNSLAAQTPPVVQGTPAFDQFLATAQWILDPADPANMAWRLTHPLNVPGTMTSSNPNRKAFIQFIEDDETVPNISNLALLGAAGRIPPAMSVPPQYGYPTPTAPGLFCYEFIGAGDPSMSVPTFDATNVPLAVGPDDESRDGFLLAPPASAGQSPSTQSEALTAVAQRQVATFLATGSPW